MSYKLTGVRADQLQEGDELHNGMIVTDFKDTGDRDYVKIGLNDSPLRDVPRVMTLAVYRSNS